MGDFEVIGRPREVEVIAAGPAVREAPRLRREYGGNRWRKMKGIATIRLTDGRMFYGIEVHWYEAHGVGKREFKVKEPL